MRILSMLTTTIVTVCLVLAGCASSLTGDVYSRDEARRSQTVRTGVITDIRTVTVEGTDSGVGKIGGAVIGGVAGSTIDGGHGRWAILGGVLGALGGGLLGSTAEERVTRTQALEITVREDSGTTRAVVQEPSSGETFQVGDRVRILTTDRGAARVSH
ncbi:Outer membrane lipoprotein SlyB [Saezia sanguinis]|uniref:Outer membrane lipoprotein SlyB n=1 Tax=Saezia sanguinis TaxID=1965230 RepID=A0A433SCF6_9BURK|nr:glycine zipper 2TM domain-containing protein [Saezia sanguinis]RUS66421.1 Outer membrane lipoprotein SlyB [Saezia sanguinis]